MRGTHKYLLKKHLLPVVTAAELVYTSGCIN